MEVKSIKIIKLVIVNLFTMCRLIGAFALPFIYIKYGASLCAICTIVLFLTDAVDGFLARALKCSTFFGSSMDALSDKLLSSISFILLGISYTIMIPPIILEVSILLISYGTFRNGGNVQSSKIGKIKTAILDICVISSFILISLPTFKINTQIINYLILNTKYIINILGCICTISQIIALNDYKRKYLLTRQIPKNIKINYKGLKKKNINEIFKDALSTEYYKKHKDESIMRQLFK